MFSTKEGMLFDRNKIKKMLCNKEYEKIHELLIIVYEKQIDDTIKDNIRILVTIAFILKHSTQKIDKYLSFIIDKWNGLLEVNKKNASRDIIELLFNTLFAHQEYNKIIEYSIVLIEC